MLGTSTPFAINVTLHKNLPYDPARDFAPMVLTSNAPFLLLVNPTLPVQIGRRPDQARQGAAGRSPTARPGRARRSI